MIVDEVRIQVKDAVMGEQREAMNIKYYDVQVKVFDKWWSEDKKPEDKRELDEAIAMRDVMLDTMKGRRG